MLKLSLLAVAVLIAGCGPRVVTDRQGYDQCLRAELFKSCLSALPAGPAKIDNSNDWDEVVGACQSSSQLQSIRMLSTVKPECQGRF